MLKAIMTKMILAFLLLIIGSLKFVDVTVGANLYEHPLEVAWQAVGLPVQEVETECWQKINDLWLNLNDLETVAKQIVKSFGLKTNNYTTGNDQEYNYISFEGVRMNGTRVRVTLQSGKMGNGSETQLGINTVYYGSLSNLQRYLREMEHSLGAVVSPRPVFSLLLTGEYAGMLSKEKVRRLFTRVLARVKAKPVSHFFTQERSQQKGFSKLFVDKEQAEPLHKTKSHTNIELETIYDAGRDKTTIVIATPRIIGEV